MTEWEKNQAKPKTEKAKRWQFLCGRKDFQKFEQIKKDTYICSLHFIGGKSPTDPEAEPVLATLTPDKTQRRQARKRKVPTPRYERVKKSAGKKLLSMATEDLAGTSFENICEGDTGCTSERSTPTKDEEKYCDKETQTVYNQYVLAAKVETMVIRNQLAVQDKESNGNIKANRMAPDVVLKDKFFTQLFPDQFEVLFNFLGPAVHSLKYWDSKGNDIGAGEEKGTKAGPSRRFTPKEELFITLLRLRQGFSLQAIAYIF